MNALLLRQFLMFGTVGTFGFLVDTAVVYALRGPMGLYGAGVVAYLAAATANWALNRVWTFRGHSHSAPYQQWMRFLVVNLGGFVVNRGLYAILVTFMPLCAEQPVFAVAAGAVAAMFLNFALSRRIVFR